MRTCDDIELELSAYQDGELTPPERALVEAHLAACPACQNSLAALKVTHAELAALPKLTSPAGLLSKVSAQIGASSQVRPTSFARPKRTSWLPIVSGIAAALLLSVLGYLYFVNPAQKQNENKDSEVANATTPPSEGKEGLRREKDVEQSLDDTQSVEQQKRLSGVQLAGKDEELQQRRFEAPRQRSTVRGETKEDKAALNSPAKPGEARTELQTAKGGANLETVPAAKAPPELGKAADVSPAPQRPLAPKPVAESNPEPLKKMAPAQPADAISSADTYSKSKDDAKMSVAPEKRNLTTASPLPAEATPPPKPETDLARKARELEDAKAVERNEAFGAASKKAPAAPAATAPATPPAAPAPTNGVADRARQVDKSEGLATDELRARRELENKKPGDPNQSFGFKDGAAGAHTGGGGRGGKPQEEAKERASVQVLLSHVANSAEALDKVKALAVARHASISPDLPIPALAEKEAAEKTVTAAVAVPPKSTQYVLTVDTNEAAALLVDLNTLETSNALKRTDPAAVLAPITAPGVIDPKGAKDLKEEKADRPTVKPEQPMRRAEAKVIIRVIIESE